VDVLLISGGNTFYLLDQFRKTGFDKYLSQFVKEKVYVGVSAGTIIATPTIEIATMPPGDLNVPGLENLRALRYVNFEVEPHCDVRRFSSVEYYSKTRSNQVYGIDDQTAIKVVGGIAEVISEGKWRLYN
jgi:dipeptidase E